jgi:hypothetical protein
MRPRQPSVGSYIQEDYLAPGQALLKPENRSSDILIWPENDLALFVKD